MKGKKLSIILVFVFVFAAVTAGVVGQAQAAPAPKHPPNCYPIDFFQAGYYGIYCLDAGNDIQTVKVDTSQSYNLTWDNTYVQLMVVVEDGTYVSWCVCDAVNTCVEGGLIPNLVGRIR